MPYVVEKVVQVINKRDWWTMTDDVQVRRLACVPESKKVLNERELKRVINKIWMGHNHGIYRTQMYQWLQEAKK